MNLGNFEKIEKYFTYFILYSVFGWLYETFLEVVVYQWGFSNRGVLLGPYCIIYGVGALVLIFFLSKLMKKNIYLGKILMTPILVFLGIVIITTTIELLGSYIMELIAGEWTWDYRRYALNYQGRIALNPSIRFGIGGMIFLYILQPIYEKIVSLLSRKTLAITSGVLALVFLIDVVITFVI